MVDPTSAQVDIDQVATGEESIMDAPVLGLKPDTYILIVSAVIGLSLLTEVITWYLIYRHDEYKQAVQKTLKEQTNVDNMRFKIECSGGVISESQ